MPCLIIAEIGVNHNGSLELAKKMVLSAKNCGADIVKFQTFTADNLTTKDAPKANYQISKFQGESQYEMLKNLELSRDDFIKLKEYCDQLKVEFCSTPFSVDDASFLYSLDVSTFKVGSGNLTDRPLHEFLSKTNKNIIISTGMSTEDEILETLELYKQEGTDKKLSLLLCTSAYPANPIDIHLNNLNYLKERFNLPIGFSDHTQGNYVSFAASALGASIIEKHFTIDKTLSGPDQLTSSSPEEFGDLVKGIRTIELSLGSRFKPVIASESEIMITSRKSIVASRDLPIGHIIEYSDLAFKRPGDGLSPMIYPKLIGKKITSKIKADQKISLENLS